MPGGRPKAKIDKEAVIKLAEKAWSAPEIAAFYHVNVSTIVRRFAKVIAEGKQSNKAKLRDLRAHAIATMAKCLETKDGKFIETSAMIRLSAAKGLASAIKVHEVEEDHIPPSSPGTINNPNAGINMKWSVRKSKESKEEMAETDLAEMFKKYVDK